MCNVTNFNSVGLLEKKKTCVTKQTQICKAKLTLFLKGTKINKKHQQNIIKKKFFLSQKLSPINPRNERTVFYYKVNNSHSIQIKEENYI